MDYGKGVTVLVYRDCSSAQALRYREPAFGKSSIPNKRGIHCFGVLNMSRPIISVFSSICDIYQEVLSVDRRKP